MAFRITAEGVREANLPARVTDLVFPVAERITFREYEQIEREAKRSYDEWSSLLHTRARLYLAIRRVDHTLANWAQLADLSLDDVEHVEEDDDADEAEADDDAPETKPADPTGSSPAA